MTWWSALVSSHPDGWRLPVAEPTGNGEDVALVAERWLPRMAAQGVDIYDAMRTIASIRNWDEWPNAWEALGAQYRELAREAALKQQSVTAGDHWLRAALAFHFGKFVWYEDRVRHEELLRQSIDAHQRALTFLDPRAVRIPVPFEGKTLVGILRLPVTPGPYPVVILLPGSDSTKEEFFHWEQPFLHRGMATFSFDGPGQGESAQVAPMRLDYETAVSAAIDVLGERPDLNDEHVAVAGVSLGGFYSIRAAAHDERIKAAVNVSGSYTVGKGRGTALRTNKALMYNSWLDNGADIQDLLAAMTLADVTQHVWQPTLVVVGDNDKIRNPEETRRVAKEIRRSTLKIYPDGNHVCFNVAPLMRPFVADWLKEHLSHA